jgi:hypothetical protein
MRMQARVALPVVVLSIVSLMHAELSAGIARVAPQSAAGQTAGGSITVPQGTKIPLTLVTPIKTKSTKAGDTVRAVVAFPVTIGTQVAIPAGTYVEGVVTSVTTKAKKTKPPAVEIHFTRLLYANGYSVTLDAESSQAMVVMPVSDVPEFEKQGTYELADAEFGAPVLFGGGQTATPPPSPGPSPALIGGIAAGVTVGLVALGVTWAHRGKNTDYILFDNGWQFQMVVGAPLVLDAGRVAAAGTAAAK